MEDFYGHTNKFFYRMFNSIMNDGVKTNARGMDTYELLHQVIEVPDPSKRVLTLYNRAANPIFQMAETVWILSGRGDAEWICHFNSQLQKFLDQDNIKGFHAPYGERLRHYGKSSRFGGDSPVSEDFWVDQFDVVIKELRNDPGSRRAVMLIGNPLFDHAKSNDRPCNIALSYKVRNGKLHATTFNRSNDMILGLTYTNIVQFTTIQESLAAILGVELGPYIHYSDSLHIYTSDKIVPKLDDRRFDVYDFVDPTPIKHNSDLLNVIEGLCIPYNIRTLRQVPKIDCPYWQSAALMIWAWDAMKEERAIAALEYLLQVQAKDWAIASLEYFVRWTKNHVKEEVVSEEIHTRIKLWIKSNLLLLDAKEVEKWVFHGASNS
jgi:thymidylate synthase